MPKYALYSLLLNQYYSNVDDVYFVSNCFRGKKIRGVTEVDFTCFYKSEFDSYFIGKKNQWWNGFWNKTIERFFILEAFMKEFNYNNVLHVELDNICFDVKDLIKTISKSSQGLYYPTYVDKTSAASVLFVNGISSISSFNNFILKQHNFDDMQLLHMYKQKNNYAHNLPVSINDSYSDQLGITDLNSIGHYFFGRDKRILRGNNRNLVISNNDIYNTLLASMSESKIEGKNFYIFHDQHRYKINNIHVHSKIHKKLTNTQYLKYMIRNAVNKNEVIIELNMYHSIKNKLLDCLLDIRSRKSKA